MTTALCVCNSCPEAVSTVNIVQTIVELDDAVVAFFHEYYTTASPEYAAGTNTITLAHVPVSNDAVQLFLNSGAQGEAAAGAQANFTVAGDVVTLLFVPAATDQLHFAFMGAV